MTTKLMTIAPLAGLAFGAHAQTADISITASKTTVAMGQRVKWTVTYHTDLTGGFPFDYFLRQTFIDILAIGDVDGTVSDMNFQHEVADLGATGQPMALIADSTPDGANLRSIHWQVNDLTGDLADFNGDTYGSPYVLGSFFFTPTAIGDSLAFDIVADQDYIDTLVTVDAPVVWSQGPGLLFEYHGITTRSDTVQAVAPAPAGSLVLLGSLTAIARRRRR